MQAEVSESEDEGGNKGDAGRRGGQGVSESKGHRSELEALKDQDPEFYKYLLETDRDLLEFEAEGSDSDGTDDESLEVS